MDGEQQAQPMPDQPQQQEGAASPASQPSPNRGFAAAGLARIGLALNILEQSLPMVGSGTDAGRDMLKAMGLLSKHIPPGSVSPGVQQTAMQGALLKQRQMQPAIAALRAQQAPQQGAQMPPQAA